MILFKNYSEYRKYKHYTKSVCCELGNKKLTVALFLDNKLVKDYVGNIYKLKRL